MINSLQFLWKKFKTSRSHGGTPAVNMDFKPNEEITIGVEVELQIIDRQTLALTDKADLLLERLTPQSKQFVPEFFKSIIEINSRPHSDVHGLVSELESLIGLADKEAEALECLLMGSGCHPSTHYGDLSTRTSMRYESLLDRNQWLMRRWMVSGMHIHLGMKSANDYIRFMLFFEHFLPHLLALSASSPFWQNNDTGLHSCRSTISEALPTASQIYTIDSWAEMTELVSRLSKSKTIASLKDLHWDIRPNPTYGTLEIRVFDMPTNLQDIIAISAFVHALALWFSEKGDWLISMPKPPMWMARENKWRAMRYGLDAEIIQDNEGHTVCIKEDLQKLIARIDRAIEAKNYRRYIDNIHSIIERGNSSQRQRQVFEASNSFNEVILHNIRELKEKKPAYINAQTARE